MEKNYDQTVDTFGQNATFKENQGCKYKLE